VEERLDRPGLFLKTRRSRLQDQRAAAPFLRGCDRRDAGLFADNAAKQQLKILGTILQ
jgi:hypothetical protein